MTEQRQRRAAAGSVRLLILVAGLVTLRGATASAQFDAGGNLDGFTVTGKGVVAAKPNRFEIDLEIAASSEMSADVIVKYRDARKRLLDAFTGLKLGNVTIQERPLAIDQKGQAYNPYYMDQPPARKGKVEVQLSRKMIASGSGIRDMDEEAVLQLAAKLLDVAQDAGGKVGGSNEYNPYYGRYMNMGAGLIRFVLDDYDAQLEKAYQAAIDDARKRAERLAKLSGVTLGPVLGIREMVTPGEKGRNSNMLYVYDGMPSSGDDEMPKRQIESSRFHEIPVRVELQVRFAVAKPVANANAAEPAPRRDGGQ